MKPTLFLSIALLLFTGGCLLGPAEFVPEPDDCSSPRALDGIESIEVGHTESGVFVPWQNGDYVQLTYGPQGGAMLGVVVSVSGRALPHCMEHTMKLSTNQNAELALTEHPVQTYEDAGGSRITKLIWMVVYGPEPLPGDPVQVTLDIGDLQLRRSLMIQ